MADTVENGVKAYMDGHEQISALPQTFLDSAIIQGMRDNAWESFTKAEFIELTKNLPPELDTSENTYKILAANKHFAIAEVHVDVLGKKFLDYLVLYNSDAGWKIQYKAYTDQL